MTKPFDLNEDPFTQKLLAREPALDWDALGRVALAAYHGIPEGSVYVAARDSWLLPDGKLKPANAWTRP